MTTDGAAGYATSDLATGIAGASPGAGVAVGRSWWSWPGHFLVRLLPAGLFRGAYVLFEKVTR